MKLRVLEEKKNELKIRIEGEEHTLPALLAWALLKDPNVDFAVYEKEHPLVSYATLFIRTKRGSPRNALEKTVKTIEDEFSDLLSMTESKKKTKEKSKKKKK